MGERDGEREKETSVDCGGDVGTTDDVIYKRISPWQH